MHRRTLPLLVTVLTAFIAVAALSAQAKKKPRPKPKQPTAPWVEIGLDQGIDWIRDPERFVDHKRKRGLTADVDRAKLLDQACARARKERKLVMWYVYRVMVPYKVAGSARPHGAGRQMYRAPILDIYAQHVLFADPDVQATIKTRFVPLRMVCDQPMGKRFDLRPLEFVEPAVVFLNEDERVVHVVERIRTFSAHWFEDLLRRVSDKHGRKRYQLKFRYEQHRMP